MTTISIRANKLSKKYKISSMRGPRWLGPRRVLTEEFAQLLKELGQRKANYLLGIKGYFF